MPLVNKVRIAAKFIDEETRDHCRVGRIEHRLGPNDLGNDAAAIDVAEQNHRNIGRAGKAHIGDIVLAQIDFRRAPGAFNKNQIRLFAKCCETAEDSGQKLWFQVLVFARSGLASHPAAHNNLGASAALRLQKDRVHVDARGHSAGACLRCLGAADFAAVRRHGGIVRHILRLERAHREPAMAIGAAETRDNQRFADAGAGALQHQALGPPRHAQNSIPSCAFTPAAK